MALEAVVEKLEDVAEPVRTEYKQVTVKGADGVEKKVFALDISNLEAYPDFAKLRVGVNKERDDHKATKQKLQVWSTFGDPTEVQSRLDRIPELEAAAEGKLDDKKLKDMAEARAKALLVPIERERDSLKLQLGERDKKLGEMTVAEKNRKVTTALNKVAKELKVVDGAADDIEMYATQFEVDDDGNVTHKDGLSPKAWLEDMQTKRPHWWPMTVGGGANGGKGGGALMVDNPFTAENWNMTKQGEVYKRSAELATKLAKAAGTTIGGKKPALKKA